MSFSISTADDIITSSFCWIISQIISIKGIIMINNKRQGATVPAKACTYCHFAAKTENNCQYVAHCIMFDIPIYDGELYDCDSELRKLCCSNGDFFTASLVNISKTDLFDWRISHENNALSRKEKHVFTIAEIVRVVLAIAMLIVTYYQLSPSQ